MKSLYDLNFLLIQNFDRDYLRVHLGCKPFEEKIFEIEILASSAFSPDSEYGFEMS